MCTHSIYDITKDVIIPFLSPLLAVLALTLFLWQEKKKLKLTERFNLKYGTKSVLRDVLVLRESYQLIGFNIIARTNSPERVQHFKDLYNKMYINLMENPDIFDGYMVNVMVDNDKARLTLLLEEFSVRIKSMSAASGVDNFILFSIYTLLYLFEWRENKINEIKLIIEEIKRTDEEFYKPFMMIRKDGL